MNFTRVVLVNGRKTLLFLSVYSHIASPLNKFLLPSFFALHIYIHQRFVVVYVLKFLPLLLHYIKHASMAFYQNAVMYSSLNTARLTMPNKSLLPK
jgi:hypothetical protein